MKPIAMADLAARHREVADDVEARVISVLRSGRYIGGPVVAEAEARAAALMGVEGAVGVNSGTDALALALAAIGVGPDDEVIVPALTFFATAGSVALLGARPVVVDVREDALIDPNAVAAARTARTRAVVPVHLYGNVTTSLDALGLPVVDDAAQAIGATPSPCQGLLSSLSTYPTKTWGAAGDGGFVLGNDSERLARVRALANHGLVAPHVHEPVLGDKVGRNSRLDAVQAAVLLGHAAALPTRIARRRSLAAHYDAWLPAAVQALPRDAGSPVHQYVVRHPRRDQARQQLTAANIQSAVYYPHSLAHQAALRRFEPAPTPVADQLTGELLALPVHAGLSTADVERVCEVLAGT